MQGAYAVPCFFSLHPAFVPDFSEVAVGFFGGSGGAFLYLFVHNLPQLHMHAVSFSSLFSEGENNSFESDRQLRCLEGRIGFHREWWCYNGLVM